MHAGYNLKAIQVYKVKIAAWADLRGKGGLFSCPHNIHTIR